jgi:tRNA uridine 5-carboxymethylaminomethyl modification enzyme
MSVHAYDVLVIGGGHAGAEAAWAASRLGARTALVTFQRDAIGRMSCNPAIGGIGKGQIVREIDALGGLMGLVTDETGIQFRMLNRRKGPAVWAPRAQADREEYAAAVRRHLEACPNLEIIETGVESIAADGGQIVGVRRADGRLIRATTVVVTSGTFLRALMHCGEEKTEGGRVGEAAAVGLSGSLAALGLRLGRLKTGTPPRLARDSIDLAALEEQHGDASPSPFSFLSDRISQPQVCCWITFTNERVHELIRSNLHRAPMYSGQIQSRGPRYCPSIEDKVVRFADKDRHQIFLEPEGRSSDRIYVNGISTSLPQEVQRAIVSSIPGLERARVLQWGYAVEYDFVPPEQIDASLMVRHVAGLFLAGQINGTSGYEEAAGQGLVAGINSARFAAGKPPISIGRDQAYIGVMIDDLVTRGVLEPYRMFTSRAEHRMHLRYDNADARLTPLGREIGLVNDVRWERFESKERRLRALRDVFNLTLVDGRVLRDWLKRPEEDGERFLETVPSLAPFRAEADVWARALVEIKYAGYIERQERSIEQFRSLESRAIRSDFCFETIPHLRREALERWTAIRPRSVGQASRVTGVSPSDVTLLLVELSRRERSQA